MRKFLYLLFLLLVAVPSHAEKIQNVPAISRALLGTDKVPVDYAGNKDALTATLDQIKSFVGAGTIGPVGPQGPAGAAGATGPAGPQGPQGNNGLSLNWRGSWTGSPTGYVKDDAIERLGSSYRALAFSSGVDPAGDLLYQYWFPVAMKGATGATGAQGVQGVQGIQGATGPTGATGATGPTGPAGSAGPAGSKGDTGVGFDSAKLITFSHISSAATASAPKVSPVFSGPVQGTSETEIAAQFVSIDADGVHGQSTEGDGINGTSAQGKGIKGVSLNNIGGYFAGPKGSIQLGSLSADPAGACTNGAVFYNNTLNVNRQCLNGSWQTLPSHASTHDTGGGDPITPAGIGAQPLIAAGTTTQYWRGDKSWQSINWLTDAPSDGSSYARQNGTWSVVDSGTISSSTPSTLASGTVMASSGTLVRPATSTDIFAILDPAYTNLTATGTGNYVAGVLTGTPSTGCAQWDSSGNLTSTGFACSTTNGITALTGDVTASGSGSVTATLAASGVTAGTYTNPSITVDAKGRVTAASTGSAGSIGGSTGSTDNALIVANGTGGATVKGITPATVNPTTGAITVAKQSGQPDGLLLANGNSTETTGAGFLGPASTMATSVYYQLPNTAPTSGQVMSVGTPATGTVHGVSSTVVPVTYRYLASGRYTPTVVNSTNVTSTSPDMAHWSRNGNEVTVTGSYSTSVSSSSTNSMVQFSLPVASTFTAQSDASGLATVWNANVTGEVIAEPTGSTVYVYVNSGVAGTVTIRYTFMYEVK